jgi:hypothetical protein
VLRPFDRSQECGRVCGQVRDCPQREKIADRAQTARASLAVGVASGLHRGRTQSPRTTLEMRKRASEAGLQQLRGKDSNLDYLIQSQASYH